MTDSSESLLQLDDVPDGGARELTAIVDGEPTSVLLLRSGTQVQAYLNICPHAGRPLNWAPGRFLIEAGLLICAAHGASFTIPDGRCVGGPCRGSQLRAVPLGIGADGLRIGD